MINLVLFPSQATASTFNKVYSENYFKDVFYQICTTRQQSNNILKTMKQKINI